VNIENPSTASRHAGSHQEHFKTDHLLSNLRGHTISSGVVTLSAQGAKFLLTLASTMILARLLMPRDFGLVAMVTAVAGFLRVFKDAGLSIATVQREKITHAQVSNLFWINVAVSTLCTLILAAAAPIIARFYHDERLIGVTLLLSATFLISGSTVQHQALLRRQMRFKALASIEVGSLAVGVVVGVVMALLRYGYWSLVASSLAIETAGLLLTWSISRWRPQRPVQHSGTGPLLRFGMHRTAADFTSMLSRGFDNLLIGRFYGAVSVGLYSRASGLLIRPLEQFLNPISAVFVPALSRLQSQPERYRAAFLRVYEGMLLIAFLGAGLALSAARPLTLVLLGPKWEQAAVIFEGFTVAALCLPLAHAASWLLVSQGRGRDMLVAQSINSVAKLLSFIAGLPYGAVGVAVAYSAYSLIIRVPTWYLIVGKTGPVRAADLWAVFFRHLPVWIVVYSGTWLTLLLVGNFSPLAQLLICGLVGFLVGAVFICSFASQRQVATRLLVTLQELKQNRLSPDAIKTRADEAFGRTIK
jgi:O-antigen/teichoic acid export membrane protein